MKITHLLAAVAIAATATAVSAAIPTYSNPGTVNPVNYSFTAANDGNIVAYFLGASATNVSVLGLEVNGVNTGLWGLNNQTSAPGASLDFGTVSAGDQLTFLLWNQTSGHTYSSVTSQNPDSISHVFSTSYSGGDYGVPAGTYVGFEDIFGGGDLDYNDLQFSFTNVNAAIPEPAVWAMLIAGFGMVGSVMRRRRPTAVAA